MIAAESDRNRLDRRALAGLRFFLRDGVAPPAPDLEKVPIIMTNGDPEAWKNSNNTEDGTGPIGRQNQDPCGMRESTATPRC
jgi:hypothetical protein